MESPFLALSSVLSLGGRVQRILLHAFTFNLEPSGSLLTNLSSSLLLLPPFWSQQSPHPLDDGWRQHTNLPQLASCTRVDSCVVCLHSGEASVQHWDLILKSSSPFVLREGCFSGMLAYSVVAFRSFSYQHIIECSWPYHSHTEQSGGNVSAHPPHFLPLIRAKISSSLKGAGSLCPWGTWRVLSPHDPLGPIGSGLSLHPAIVTAVSNRCSQTATRFKAALFRMRVSLGTSLLFSARYSSSGGMIILHERWYLQGNTVRQANNRRSCETLRPSSLLHSVM